MLSDFLISTRARRRKMSLGADMKVRTLDRHPSPNLRSPHLFTFVPLFNAPPKTVQM